MMPVVLRSTEYYQPRQRERGASELHGTEMHLIAASASPWHCRAIPHTTVAAARDPIYNHWAVTARSPLLS